MNIEIRMPSLGMAMDEGKVVAWRVKPGDRVLKGDILVEIEGDKTAVEIEAPEEGVIGPLLVQEGDTVAIETVLVNVLTNGDAAPVDAPTPITASSVSGGRPVAPLARRLAAQHGVSLDTVTGTGPGGRILEKDILKAAQAPAALSGQESGFTLKPLSLMRAAIAKRTAQSAAAAPHFSLGTDIGMAALLGRRAAMAPRLMAELGLRLTITDLLISDVAATLPAFPELNACFSADGIQLWSSVNIALAVALPDGLSAPVIRGADKLKLPEISAVRAGLVERARAGKSTSKDLNDATFTVSNLGTSRVDFFTAILTTGQSSILSMGRIRERLVVMQPTALVEPYATFVLTIDHRVTDGAVGAAFLEALATRIEAHATDGDLPSTPRDGDV